MRRRLAALFVALTIVFSVAGSAIASHSDPHVGSSLGFPNPNSQGTAYRNYIKVCLASNIGGGPVWDGYGQGFYTQDRIRDAMANWNQIGGEAHLFASNSCTYSDTYILVSYDTYSDFAELSQDLWHFCGEPGGICWDKATLHWNKNLLWYTGNGTPPANQYDAWSMFTHEFGHAFYLDESNNTAATMYGSMGGPGRYEKRSLHGYSTLDNGVCGSHSYSDILGYKTSFGCTH